MNVVTSNALPRWPELPAVLESLLYDIEAEQGVDPRHPRPWDLATLPEHLHDPTWNWLEDAVRWINHCTGWQPVSIVPPCWPEHPHLALELAVLAFGRELAARAHHPDALRAWHDDAHTFQRRLTDALGESGLKQCQRGGHGDRPSTYELDRYATRSGHPQPRPTEVVHRFGDRTCEAV